jgi:hypothetical protein
MAHDTIGRKRFVNVSKLSNEQADTLAGQMGEKITMITDEAVKKVNKILNIYGLEAKMQITVSKLDK